MVDADGGNLEICSLNYRKMRLRAPAQLKMSLKNLSTTTGIFDKSHDVVLK